jgi:hypothetical protein
MPAQVRIRTGPVANAGPAQTVKVGETVQLDGSQSFDPEGRPLTFHWTLSPPPGSQARLSDSTAVKPTVVADVMGPYKAELTVTDSAVSSEPEQTQIAATTVALSCGSLVSGYITQPGQTDPYTFQGQTNEILTLTLVDTGGFAGGPAVVSLFAPSGQKLTSFAANSQQQISLSATGTYAIQVVGSGNTATGKYNLGLACRNPNSPVRATLGCGALTSGSLTSLGQLDQYTFQGQANEILTLTLVDTGNNTGAAFVSLFAPSGQALTSFSANSQQQISLSATGTYVIQVVGGYYTAKGQYNLGLVCQITAPPVFSPPGGTYSFAQSVTITDATPGATIYYTTNGSTPTTSSTKYTGAIKVSISETIKAIAVAIGYTPSTVSSATYTILGPAAATPVFWPPAATYVSVQSVTITDATPGATIYYTTNGSTPTTSSTKYTGPIMVSTSETIKAIATAAGYRSSAVAIAAYALIGSPSALAAPATSITTSGATLHAIVDTLGVAGSYAFHYGTSSSALNTTTAATVQPASAAKVYVSASITGLASKTTYYYEIVARTPGGTSTDAVLHFTTN